MAAIGWSLYAAWEWLVQMRTPQANIRVDLLVMWPVLAILSAWALIRTLTPALRDAATRRHDPGARRRPHNERHAP